MEKRPPDLVLGPLLRYAGTESATFWVETSAPCEVEILGHRTSTFAVEGHHYALLLVSDLTPASVTPYDVRLDGELVWPPDDGRPQPVVHTRNHEPRTRLVFGSCRVGDPQPTKLGPVWPDDVKALGIDALWTYSKQLQRGEMEWPDAVLLLGDQMYADEVSPGTLEFIRQRRGTDVPPGEQVADFEEYTRLYRESWSEPDIRWLLSTVPTAMIFDDHDVHDDWNISWRWVEEMRRKPWWEARITGAFMAYWIYQHLGNLSPPELDADTTLPQVKDAEDAGPLLRGLAHKWDRESAASRWAFYRDFGDTRLLVLDSRAARVLSDGRRQMIDDEEWDWIVEHSSGAFDHVADREHAARVPAPRHPPPPGMERGAVRRALGRLAASLSERLRRAVDLEHWAAFNRSFEQLCDWLRAVARGTEEPAARLRPAARRRRPQQLDQRGRPRNRRVVPRPPARLLAVPQPALGEGAAHRPGDRLARLRAALRAARAARRSRGAVGELESAQRATFDNSLGELLLDGRTASATFRRSPREGEDPELLVADRPIALAGAGGEARRPAARSFAS